MTQVLIVSVEPPWPATHGGRIRTARLAETLSEHGARVQVCAPAPPDSETPTPSGIDFIALAAPKTSLTRRFLALTSHRPKLGTTHMQHNCRQLHSLATGVDVVIWSHDYLLAACPDLNPPRSFIDLANNEYQRQKSLAKSASLMRSIPKRIESFKARFWEPRTWRSVDAVFTLNSSEHEDVKLAGAHAVFAPNGCERVMYEPSPVGGNALMVGSFNYQPNRLGAEWLANEVWPRVIRSLPTARLVIAGRNASSLRVRQGEGIELRSDFGDPLSLYREAAVVVAPVATGGGSQLKLYDALAHHRVVVARPYAQPSLSERICNSGQIVFAEAPAAFAASIASNLTDARSRHISEVSASTVGALQTWNETLRDVINAVLEVEKAS